MMVRPRIHKQIKVHRTIQHPNPQNGTVHFDPQIAAHMMEWPHIFDEHNVTLRPPKNFKVRSDDEIHVHDLTKAFNADSNGEYLVQYDDHLEEWFHYMIGRASNHNSA